MHVLAVPGLLGHVRSSKVPALGAASLQIPGHPYRRLPLLSELQQQTAGHGLLLLAQLLLHPLVLRCQGPRLLLVE